MHNRKQQISTTGDARPDPEVVASAKRRSFSKADKLRILAAANAWGGPWRHWRIPLAKLDDYTGIELDFPGSYDDESGEPYFGLFVGESYDVSDVC